jgi:hypothetical protein
VSWTDTSSSCYHHLVSSACHSSCEFGILSSSCELDRHITIMLSSSCELWHAHHHHAIIIVWVRHAIIILWVRHAIHLVSWTDTSSSCYHHLVSFDMHIIIMLSSSCEFGMLFILWVRPTHHHHAIIILWVRYAIHLVSSTDISSCYHHLVSFDMHIVILSSSCEFGMLFILWVIILWVQHAIIILWVRPTHHHHAIIILWVLTCTSSCYHHLVSFDMHIVMLSSSCEFGMPFSSAELYIQIYIPSSCYHHLGVSSSAGRHATTKCETLWSRRMLRPGHFKNLVRTFRSDVSLRLTRRHAIILRLVWDRLTNRPLTLLARTPLKLGCHGWHTYTPLTCLARTPHLMRLARTPFNTAVVTSVR